MTKINNQKKLRLKAIILCIVTCLLTSCLCFLTACNEESDQKFVNTSSETDTQRITNGNFEFYDTNGGYDVIMSPRSWSLSTGTVGGKSASSSNASSGIIYTGNSYKNNKEEIEKGWDFLTGSQDAEKNELFGNTLRAALVSDDTAEDGSLISAKYSIDEEDIPTISNPKTHDDKDGHILMLHNSRDGGSSTGTAQYYSSSTTITLKANTSAIVSVWVYTDDLTYGASKYDADDKFNGGAFDVEGDRGAYIAVKQSIGGYALDTFEIKNISTNKTWQQYSIAVKSSNYNETTFSISLGLGQGSTTLKNEYVNGYAFFDDVTCSINSLSELATYATTNGITADTTCKLDDFGSDKKFDVGATAPAATLGKKCFMIDLTKQLSALNYNATCELTKEELGGTNYTTSNYPGLGFEVANDITETFTSAQLDADNRTYLTTAIKNELKSFSSLPSEPSNFILMLSANGASYTTTITPTGADADTFELESDENLMISFWVKTSDMTNFTGLTANVVDYEKDNIISSINSVTVDAVDVDNAKDLFKGWTQCCFFITNTTSAPIAFELELSFGPTEICDSTRAKFKEGYAAITSIEYANLSTNEHSNVTSSTRTQSVSLFGEDGRDILLNGFDSVTYSDIYNEVIKTGVAKLRNYYGVEGGSSFVSADGTSKDINTNDLAGLVNRYYAEDYFAQIGEPEGAWLLTLLNAARSVSGGYDYTTDPEAATNWWGEIFGDSIAMPLVIANPTGDEYQPATTFQSGVDYYTFDGTNYISAGSITEFAEGVDYFTYTDETESYGFIATQTTTVSANTYQTISIDVFASTGAVAYIYLIDSSDVFEGYTDNVKIKTSKLAYWYDDDGNVYHPYDTYNTYIGDEDDFSSESYVVYTMQPNGLHTDKDGKYFANLSIYDTDDKGNKITSNEEIVFHYNQADKKFYYKYTYATKTYSIEVNDFDHKYAKSAGTENELFYVVDGNDPQFANQWVTVNFYIATGNTEKDFRLEVWSGSRDGVVKCNKGSYVLFNNNSPETLAKENYDTLVAFAKEYICDLLSSEAETITDLDEFYKEVLYINRTAVKNATGDIIGYNFEGSTTVQNKITIRGVDFVDADEDGYIEGIDIDGDGKADVIYNTYNLYDDIDYTRFDEDSASEDEANPYSEYLQENYAQKVSYLKFLDANSSSKLIASTIADFTSIDVTIEAAEDSEEEEETTDDEDNGADIWLLVGSIILVVALLGAMVAMLVREIVKRSKRTKKVKNSKYTSKRKHYIKDIEDGEDYDDDIDDDDADVDAKEVEVETESEVEEEVTEEELYAGNQEKEESETTETVAEEKAEEKVEETKPKAKKTTKKKED